MFRSHLRRRHRFGSRSGLSSFGAWGDPLHHRSAWGGVRPWRRSRRPTWLTVALAGLVVFALIKLATASGRSRSTAEKLGIGALILVLGGLLASLRRSASRHDWSI